MSNNTYAQTYRVENSSTSANPQMRADQFKLFSSQAGSLSNTKNVSASNNIYIQQQGNNNDAISNTRSVYSNIGLYQQGNNNNILLNITAGAISENILQSGINNSVIDLSSKGSVLHKTAVI